MPILQDMITLNSKKGCMHIFPIPKNDVEYPNAGFW